MQPVRREIENGLSARRNRNVQGAAFDALQIDTEFGRGSVQACRKLAPGRATSFMSGYPPFAANLRRSRQAMITGRTPRRSIRQSARIHDNGFRHHT
jgi:hypothetical protein